MHAGGDGEELDRLLTRLAEIRREEGDTRDDFEVHVISYDAYDPDGIKRLEDKGVTDCIVGFRVPYIKGPDTEPLEKKIEHLERYAEQIIGKVVRWRDLTRPFRDAVEEAERLIAGADFIRTEQDLLEGYDYLAGRIRASLQMAFDHDLDRPVLINSTHQFARQGLDNPDALYWSAYLTEDAEYVVRGRRGTTADLSFQVMGGSYSADAAPASLAAFDDRELDLAPDGSFEWRFGPMPGAKTLIVREVFNDWDTEERGTLWIERTDTVGRAGPAAAAGPPGEEVRDRRQAAHRLHPDLVRLPAVLPVPGAGQHPHRPGVDARRAGVAALLDRALRAGRGRGDGRDRPGVHRLRLPGDPDRVGLVRLHRLRDPPDLAHQGPGGHRPRRPDAVRGLRARAPGSPTGSRPPATAPAR